MLTDVKDKVVWITGASSGIGAAAAVALSEAGARVIVSGRREDRLNALAQTLDGAEVAVLDVSDATAVNAVVAMILEKFGRIDILVHSAGLNVKNRAWSELTIEDWNTVIQVDLNGAFYCCQAVLPFMRTQKDGLIINISSWAGDT